MISFRTQSQVFCATALIISVVSLLFIRIDMRLDQQLELIVLAILIIVLGVPHGALDTIFVRQLYKVNTAKGWMGFVVIYLMLAILVVTLWFFAPILFLAGFLAISIVHFSGDLPQDTSIILRIAYGGAIIVLPTLLHVEEVIQLFSFLVDNEAAKTIANILHLLAWPWIAMLVLFGSDQIRKNKTASVEVASVGLLAVVAPPLVAFTVYFCCMHSSRHIMRTYHYLDKSSAKNMVVAAVGPMAAVTILTLIASVVFRDMPLDARITQIVFIGLAALTVPHMALVEQVRLSGWTRSSSSH
jgi:Brp/Blh family beta-carotene 15,15'-monooxygenase